MFEIHIHASLACTSCSVSSDSSNLIPLLSTPPTTTADSQVPVYETKTKATREQERRDKMRGLKAQFFPPSKPSPSPSTSAPPKRAFVDRAKARRERNGPSDSTPVPPSNPFFSVPGSTSSSTQSSAPPSNPFATTSRGALLLSKISSNPSPSTGGKGGGLGTLIQPRTISSTSSGKAGLGSQPLVPITALAGTGDQEGVKRGWREDGKERSWKRFREGEGSGL